MSSFMEKIIAFFSKNKKENQEIKNKSIIEELIEEDEIVYKNIEKNIDKFLDNIDEVLFVKYIKDLIKQDLLDFKKLQNNKNINIYNIPLKIFYPTKKNYICCSHLTIDLYRFYIENPFNKLDINKEYGYSLFISKFINKLNNIILKNREIFLDVKIDNISPVMFKVDINNFQLNIMYNYTKYSDLIYNEIDLIPNENYI
jgi:hypothetical protein